ncbi:MAG TPA: indoleacetamide hydrolase [Caldimonas sp.]|nr:indoleacetamide hydrolase [Caldimonas sp.]HEX2541687.1 indoleacetamide hydrolase [Caldimonas sp.]
MSERRAPTPAEMLAMSSGDVVAAIRSGRMSAESYVVAALDRAERLKDLNAFITLDRAGSTAQARRVDDMRGRGTALPPLAGLPIVVKDNINSRDLPTTGGTAALRNVRPRANAPVLQRLVEAGAIVLGKTNLHELAFGITSTNLASFAGPVKNPYDRTRIPGGSSGGTAVAIAARIVPSGLGTDTGGSTRIPAALCGIAGLRPSVGNGGTQRRYNGAGVLPISHTRDTIGPMGRSIADLALLDAVITGGAPATAVPLGGVRIGVPASFWSGLERQLATVVTDARNRLAAAGVVFVDVDLPGLADLNGKVSFPVALHEPIADIPAYLAATGVSGIDIAQIAQQIASPDVKGAFGAIQADAMGAGYNDALRVFRPQLQALYADYFRANRVEAMLFPTTVAAAVPIDTANGSGKFSIDGGPRVDTFGTFIRNTDPGSNAGIPGLAFPAGATASGLPVGLELDGPLGSDRRLMSIGLAMEAVLDKLPPPAL